MSSPLQRSCGQSNREPAEGEADFQQCGGCKGIRYCSSDCQRLAWTSHKKTCQLAGLAPVPKSATTLIPAMCGACKKTANLVCDGCHNMTYCSSECQQTDTPIHKILCGTFKNFHVRPAPNFFRGIYFPEKGGDPHFVWYEAKGLPFWQALTDATTDKYLGRGSWNTVDFDSDERFARPFSHQVSVYHRTNFLIDGSGVNACVAPLVGEQLAHRWRGPFLATSRKYMNMEQDYGVVEAKDRDPNDEFGEIPLVLMDLDTTSLSPVIAHFKLVARSSQLRATRGVAAETQYRAKVAAGYGVDIGGESA